MLKIFKKENKLSEAEVMRNLSDEKFVNSILTKVKEGSEEGIAVISIWLKRRSFIQTKRIAKILKEKGYSVTIKSKAERPSFGIIGADWDKDDNYIEIWL